MKKISIVKILLICLVLMVLLPLPRVLKMPWFLKQGEITNHIAIANEIKNFKSLPPNQPLLYGEKNYYPWIYHVVLALASIYSGVPAFVVIHYFQIYSSLLFFLGAFLLGCEYFRNVNIGIVFMVLVSLFWFQLFYVPSVFSNYALIIIVLYLYIFVYFIKTRSKNFAFLTGMVCASLMYIQVFAFIFAFFVLYSFCLYGLISKKINLKQLIFLLLPLVLVIPYYLHVKHLAGSTFLFEPFAGLVFNYLKIFHILLIPLFFGIAKVVKSKDEIQVVFLILIIVLLIFVNTVVMTHTLDIVRFVYFMIFPITFIGLNYIRNVKSFIKYVFIGTSILLFLIIPIEVYSVIDNLNFYFYNQDMFKKDEYVAAEWIKENTDVSDIVLMSPLSLLSAVTERRTVISYPFGLMTHQLDPKEHFIDVAVMYTDPSKELYDKYNVSYLFFCEPEFEFLSEYDLLAYDFSKSSTFEVAVEYDNCSIFKVIDTTKLPVSTDRNIKEKLITAKYSRWWTID